MSNRWLNGPGGDIFCEEKFKIFGKNAKSASSRAWRAKFDKSFYLAWNLLIAVGVPDGKARSVAGWASGESVLGRRNRQIRRVRGVVRRYFFKPIAEYGVKFFVRKSAVRGLSI